MAILALLVIGPKDLPVVMRKLGRGFYALKRAGQEFMHALDEKSGGEIKSLKEQFTGPVRQIVDLEGNLREAYDVNDPDITPRTNHEHDEKDETSK